MAKGAFSQAMTYIEHMRIAGRTYLEETLIAAGNSPTVAAEIAGVKRSTLYRLMKRHSVNYVGKKRRDGGTPEWHLLGIAG